MAPVTFKPITTQIQAPDYTKAGSVFSKALEKIGQAGADYRQGQIDVAGTEFAEQVRGAGTLGELGQIDTEALKARGASTEEIVAAETNLRSKQAQIFGTDLQIAFQEKQVSNLEAMQSIVQQTEGLADTITFDAGGNPVFGENPLKLTEIEKQNKQQFQVALKTSGFVPVRTSQQSITNIREEGRKFGFSEEQTQSLIAQDKTYRSELSTLDAGQQAQVAGISAGIERDLVAENNQIQLEQDQLAIQYRYTTEEATKLLSTNQTEVFAHIDKKGGNEKSWLRLFQKGGMDIKEHVTELFTDNPDLSPWVVMNALQEVLDVEVGSEQVNTKDFNKVIDRIAADSDLHDRLDKATQLDSNTALRMHAASSRAALRNQAAVSRFTGGLGIRNVSRNAQLATAQLQRAAAETAPVESITARTETVGRTNVTDGFIPDADDIIVDTADDEESLKQTFARIPDPLDITPKVELTILDKNQTAYQKLQAAFERNAPLSELTDEELNVEEEDLQTGRRISEVSDEMQSLLNTRANSTEPFSVKDQMKLLDLQFELLQLGDASSKILKKARKDIERQKQRIKAANKG